MAELKKKRTYRGGGPPKKIINMDQLKQLMRLNPTLADTAAFFECSERHIDRVIKTKHKLTFVEFRKQNMVHTRLMLVRTMIKKAEQGDNTMLIWCSKNLIGWSDKIEQHVNVVPTTTRIVSYDEKEQIELGAKLIEEKDE